MDVKRLIGFLTAVISLSLAVLPLLPYLRLYEDFIGTTELSHRKF